MHLAALYFPTPKSDDARLAPAASSLTAIAVDKDKNSLHAVKWALEQRFIQTAPVTLIHVRCRTSLNQGHATADTSPNNDSETTQLFLPYKGLCARKRVAMKEVVLEDTNVAKAIIEFINSNNILNIVVGASNRNAFTRKFRNSDLPSCLLKSVPEFCAVYVISKGRPVSVRSAKSAAPVSAVPPKQVLTPTIPQNTLDPHGSVRLAPARGGRRGLAPPSPLLDKRSFERTEYMKDMGIPKIATNNMVGNLDSSAWRRKSYGDSRDAFPDDLEYYGSIGSVSSTGSADFSESLDSSFSTDSSKSSYSPISAGNKDIDSEMKRLRLELKQTMDMYNTACKETVTANQKTREIHRWKMEESRKVDESRQAEETTLKIAEIKAKCKAANEAAEAAQRIAELEAKKRLTVELRAKCDAQGNKKASDSMAHSDIQYRKFTIDEIEVATEYFSDSKKIGEGGYGHVYKGSLDHTPVAIKVLRPDAAQGRQQFQQEIEVLSCIRHPNMVLLLGACPEYGCLVYEYMDNGSLEDRLNRRGNTPPIPWRARFQISAEIATGLLFLHQNKPEPLVHRDLKPANILLDRNYRSKISDVGLARLVPPSVADSVTQYHMTSAAGTFCYIDPEYQQTGMLGVKSDIYSLGIMLLQIITAKAPMGLTHHVERAIERGTFADILDPAVKDWPVAEVLSYAKLALKCAELRKKDRPDLGTVILPELNRLSCLRQ